MMLLPTMASTAHGWPRLTTQGIVVRELLLPCHRLVTEVVATLTEVRLVGNPGPRKAAENLTALLGELADNLTTPPRWWEAMPARIVAHPRMAAVSRHLPPLAALHERARQRDEPQHTVDECLRALGEAHRDFILVARLDLGSRRRWQVWRRTEWPGRWPGPDGRQLIEQARQRALAASPGGAALPGVDRDQA
jgi:hypothetical protein